MTQTTLTNLCIILMLAVVGICTSSPLVVLGLLLLQSQPATQYVAVQQQDEGDDEEDEDDGTASTHKIGFRSELKQVA